MISGIIPVSTVVTGAPPKKRTQIRWRGSGVWRYYHIGRRIKSRSRSRSRRLNINVGSRLRWRRGYRRIVIRIRQTNLSSEKPHALYLLQLDRSDPFCI